MSRQFQFVQGNFNLFPAISIYSRQFQLYSQQFQFCSRQFQFNHCNFNLLTVISICSRQFQLTHGNFNVFSAIPTYSAILICSRQRSRHFSLRSPPVSYGGRQWPPKVKTQNQESIFKVDLQSEK